MVAAMRTEIEAGGGKAPDGLAIGVDDVGTVLNPLSLKGQIHGGIAQGVGQVLMEDISVDPVSGQVITGSFAD